MNIVNIATVSHGPRWSDGWSDENIPRDRTKKVYLLSAGLVLEPNRWFDVVFEERDGYRWITQILESAEGRHLWETAKVCNNRSPGKDICHTTVWVLSHGSEYGAQLNSTELQNVGAPEHVLKAQQNAEQAIADRKSLNNQTQIAGKMLKSYAIAERFAQFRFRELPEVVRKRFGKRRLLHLLQTVGLGDCGCVNPAPAMLEAFKALMRVTDDMVAKQLAKEIDNGAWIRMDWKDIPQAPKGRK